MSRYSHSRLNCFQQCPRKFLWRYVWKVSPATEGVEAFLGKRVHDTLESLYEDVIRGVPAPELADLLGRFERLWDRTWSDSIRIVADQPAEYYRRAGDACLTTYYKKHYPFDAGTTVGVEKWFEFPIDADSPHTIRGVIDRVDIAPDGAVEVHDYKTGKRAPSLQALAADQQVGFYEMAARILHPDRRRVRMVWHYLRTGVEHRLPSRDPEEVRTLRRSTLASIERIERTIASYRRGLDAEGLRDVETAAKASCESVPEAGRREAAGFPTRVSPLCRWCEFLPWCKDGCSQARIDFRPPPPPEPPPPPAPKTPPGQGRLF